MSDFEIYTGFWINWSQGRDLGRTLTVTSSTGGILIAFLALFVTLALTQLWEILCYCFHFWRSSPEERNALYHQSQVLLRSGSSAFSFALNLARVLWKWRHHRSRSYKVCLAMVTFAVAFTVCTIAAGLSSSQVANAGSAVLVLPIHCGWPPHTHEETNLTLALPLYLGGIRIFENSRAYVQKCYGQTSGPNGASCNTFVKTSLDRILERNVDCPFAPGMCESNAVRLSSGYINSHEDLGINAAPEDRIRFKKVLTCAVINAENNYSTPWVTEPSELQGMESPIYRSKDVAFKIYHLGSQIIGGVKAPYSFYFANITLPRSGYQTQVFATSTSEPIDAYGYDPIPELWKNDSLVFLWALENKVAYTEPIQDPWFKATTPGLNGQSRVWRADKAAGVMACVEQYEFCNTTSCLGPLSIPVREEYFPNLDYLNYNEKQKATFWYLRKAALYGRAYLPPMLLQDELLRAREQVFQDPIYGASGISMAIPDNQWEIEVENLFNVSLAFLQHMSVEHVSNSNIRITPNTTLRDWIEKETYPGAEEVCESQMVRSTAYLSLNVVGLSCIIGIGGLLMLLSVLLPIIMPWVCMKWSNSTASLQDLEWKGNDSLQLLFSAWKTYAVFQRNAGRDSLLPPNPNQTFRPPWLVGYEKARDEEKGTLNERGSSDEERAGEAKHGATEGFAMHHARRSTGVILERVQTDGVATVQSPEKTRISFRATM